MWAMAEKAARSWGEGARKLRINNSKGSFANSCSRLSEAGSSPSSPERKRDRRAGREAKKGVKDTSRREEGMARAQFKGIFHFSFIAVRLGDVEAEGARESTDEDDDFLFSF